MTATRHPANEAVLRALQLLELLCSAVPHGLPNKEIAAQLGASPSTANRTLAALIEKGWVQQLESGRYAVTARYSQQCFRVLASFEKAQRRLADAQRNYTLGA